MKERELRRISLLIGEDQYATISERGLNLSWLIRDLIDDYLSERKIVLDVSEGTLGLYQQIVSMAGAPDEEFEPFFRSALHTYLKTKIEAMQKFEKSAFTGKTPSGKKS